MSSSREVKEHAANAGVCLFGVCVFVWCVFVCFVFGICLFGVCLFVCLLLLHSVYLWWCELNSLIDQYRKNCE